MAILSYPFSNFSMSFRSFNTIFCYLRPGFSNTACKSKIISFPVIHYSLAYIYKGHINSFCRVVTSASMRRGFSEHCSLHPTSGTRTPTCRAVPLHRPTCSFDGLHVLFTTRLSFPIASLLSSSLHTTLLIFVLCKDFSSCVLLQTIDTNNGELWYLHLTLMCPRNHGSVQSSFSINSDLLSSVRHFIIHLMYILMLLNSANV